MGRGRQKAKQQKIARKLKYLTTDTDYDELAKELSSQEPGTGSVDLFSHDDEQYVDNTEAGEAEPQESDYVTSASSSVSEDDLDEYAKWAAEAAAKATSGEIPAVNATPVRRKPIPMPKPSAFMQRSDNK